MTGSTYPRRRAGARYVGLFFGVLLLLWVPLSVLAAPFAALVMDARSGEVIFARNHDTPLHPASLTKMMTLYVAFEAIQNGEIGLDTMITVSAKAAAEPPSKLGLRAGQRIALRHLIRAAAVRSGNDAATAIGEAISGSEEAFTDRMTRTARAMGMTTTTFKNAHGLTRTGHMSTARDMTILGRQLFFDYPQYYNLFSRRSTDAGVAQVLNTNRRFLDAYRGADGIKTGYTRAAGFNLTGSAERGGKRIIATVFGGQSVAHRNAEMARLLDLGFERAPTQVAVRRPARPAYQGNTAVAAARAPDTVTRTVRLQTTLTRSPVPPLRPATTPAEPSEDVLIAVQGSIEAVLAEVAEASVPEPETPAVEAEAVSVAAVAAAPLPPTRPPEIQVASAEVVPAPDAAAPSEPQVVEQATPVSEIDPETVLADVADEPDAAPEMRVAGLVAMPSPPDTATDTVPAVMTTPPSPRPDNLTAARDIVLTSSGRIDEPAAADVVQLASATTAPSAPETVRRTVSTSDPRAWGVHVGRYPSRFDAERVLVQTALAELSTLDSAVRRVQQRNGGYDANFVGLSQDQADLACRRLQAQDRLCFTLAP